MASGSSKSRTPDARGPEAEFLPEVAELLAYGRALLAEWKSELSFGVRYNRRMRTRAGAAWLRERRIDLNPRLLARHPEQVHETFAHELAHLVVFVRFGRDVRPHGCEWQQLMLDAGFEPSRCHRMDVTGLGRKKRKYWFLYLCRHCPGWWIQRHRVASRCPDCARRPGWVYRADRSPAGHRRLVRIARAHAAAS